MVLMDGEWVLAIDYGAGGTSEICPFLYGAYAGKMLIDDDDDDYMVDMKLIRIVLSSCSHRLGYLTRSSTAIIMSINIQLCK